MSISLQNPGDAVHLITSVAGRNIVVAGAGNSVNPGSGGVGTPIGYVTSLVADTPARQVITTSGSPSMVVAKIVMSYNAPVALGTGTTQFSGVQYVIDDGTKLTKLDTFPFSGVGGGPESDTLFSTPLLWPDTVQTWRIYAVSASTTGGVVNDLIKQGNPNATPSVTVSVGGSGPAPDVVFFLCGKEASDGNWTSVMYWNETNTEMRIDWAVVAPADRTNFYGVKIWIDPGVVAGPPTNGALTQTTAGSLLATTYYVRSAWITSSGESKIASETNLSVLANKVLNVAAPSSPPVGATGWNVYVSTVAGKETRQNGNTPIAVGTPWVEPTSGLVTGASFQTTFSAATGVVPFKDFLLANDGTRYYRDTISIAFSNVPASPQNWTFIVQPYNTADPPVGNTDTHADAVGVFQTLKTLKPANVPNFNPPGAVLNADWNSSSDATPNTINILAVYTPAPQTQDTGPLQGVDLFLRESGPGIVSGGLHDGTGRRGWQHLGSFDGDGTSNEQVINIQHTAATQSGQTWDITFRPYGPNQSGANSNTTIQANDVTVSHAGPLYAGSSQIGTNVTAVSFTTYDQAGNPCFGLEGTFPIPADPLFAFCRITLRWDGDTAETVLAEQSDGEFLTDSFNAYPDESHGAIITFYAVNQMGQQNNTNPPTARVTISRPIGVPGREWVEIIRDVYATVITSVNESGVEMYAIQGGWNLPAGPPSRQHRGVIGVLRVAGQRDLVLWKTDAVAFISTSASFPKPPAAVNGTVYFVSVDANNRANSITDGTGGTALTPSAAVTIAPSASGNLQLTRARSDQFGTGLTNTGTRVIVDQLPGFALQAFTLGQAQLQQFNLIDTARIVDGAIGQIKLQNAPIIDGFRMQDLIVTNAKIAYGSVDFFNIKNLAVQRANLAFASVGTEQVDNLAVKTAKIDYLAVGQLQLGYNSVGGNQYQDLSITSQKIQKLTADKLDVSQFIQVGFTPMTTTGQQGIAIVNGGSLSVSVGGALINSQLQVGYIYPWVMQPGLGLGISGNGFVNANGGFRVNGVWGLTQVKVVGSNTFYVNGGIITAIT